MINADEADLIDYDTSFKGPNQDAIYAPDPYRSSDHDPVVIGLDLTATPKQAKNHAVTVLEDLLPTGNRSDDKRIEKAIDSINDSLKDAYWVVDDDFHLTDKGKKVFDEEKKAVKDLMKVRRTDVQSVIDALVGADEVLAATAIADAIEQGGNERDIARAEAEMVKGEADVAAGKPDKAIDHFKRAWQWAQKAL